MKTENASKFQEEFIEAAGQVAASFSFSRSVGQIYAFLYISQKPLSLDDLCSHLKISKGNGSVNLRNLENWGAVHKVWIKGSRRAHYTAVRDIQALAMRRIEEGIRRRLGMAKGYLSRLDGSINGDAFGRERVAELKSFLESVEMALEFLPKAQAFLKSDFLGKHG